MNCIYIFSGMQPSLAGGNLSSFSSTIQKLAPDWPVPPPLLKHIVVIMT